MTTIMPEGEAIRKAVKWISERRGMEDGTPLYKLIEEAGLKYNLSPKDEEFLTRFLLEGTKKS